MKKNNTKTSLLNKNRITLAFLIFAGLLFLLCIKIGWVQVVNQEKYTTKAITQQMKDEVVSAKRGNILDRNNNELAVSLEGYSVWIRPGDAAWGDTEAKQEENLEATVTTLAELIGEDKDTLLTKVKETDKTLLKVSKFVKDDVAEQIRSASLTGVSLSEETKRYYPLGEFLSQTLGSVSDDGTGVSGIELQYNSYLKGVSGRWLKSTDLSGNVLADGTEKYYEPEDGSNVVLTIDQVIQNYTEQSVKESYEEYNAKRVSCIVMETKTGEILAMASAPSFDPNNASVPTDEAEKEKYDAMTAEEKMAYLNEMWRNTLISDVYEPGSTAKLITTAACIEEGITSKDEIFNCTGSYSVSGVNVKCWSYTNPHGTENLYESVGNSCNPVFMQLALRLGEEKYYNYLEAFGITEKTGIDFPGEASSILVSQSNVTKLDLAIMGFGQTNAVTPIQIVTAISAFGNDGYVMEPHLVKAITDSDGNVIEEIEPKVVRRAVSSSTASEMCDIMQFVVDEGGGEKAQIDGYTVGGKTGSSQVASDSGGYTDQVIASFVGMAPMSDPEITILYIIDSPEGGQHGGTIAAPATKELLEKILKYREVKPDKTESSSSTSSTTSDSSDEETVTVPNVTGIKYSEAKKILEASGLNYKVSPETSDSKDFVIKEQYPESGSTTQKNGIVYLYKE